MCVAFQCKLDRWWRINGAAVPGSIPERKGWMWGAMLLYYQLWNFRGRLRQRYQRKSEICAVQNLYVSLLVGFYCSSGSTNTGDLRHFETRFVWVLGKQEDIILLTYFQQLLYNNRKLCDSVWFGLLVLGFFFHFSVNTNSKCFTLFLGSHCLTQSH